ncbi:Deoxycytidine monophosphate (dCMP) deaminase [Elasticomyces elasticus]|nr:Deoxycytidine monophosphate (dCMP) deaminase [Elasticomyces elasticus]KAK3652732.1 Deoxycytidine monophosphate (dCMP) deaminase [Elasticomyces elasticus]KAK4908361.1 Deoxycytidine monophosphate (dCMP) deaminase [Elasticomyces elasticus]KAK5748401.1 Deoxycytidine monophosphate (dCMP) deaminase [Elasticomyces elasticus]
MLIGICGGICAGKHSIQNYLVERHGFEPLELAGEIVPSVEKSASQTEVPRSQGTAAARLPFASVNDLVEFTTANWQKNFCTTSIHSEAVVEALCHRPFFVLVHVDAPISIRWQRFKDRCTQASVTPPTLEQFVLRNDEHLYNAANRLASLASRAQVKLLNSTTSLSKLHPALDALNLTDPSRMRPTWDHYFMTLASLAARRSNCMRRQVGCVLVRSNRVISTGYNGTPRNVKNCNDGGCPRCNDGGGRSGVGLSTCLCLHAEENALLEAGRERVGGGAVLYCNTCPCLTCSIKIVQVGITEVVFNQSYYMDAEAAKIFNEAGLKLRQFSPPKEGLVTLADEAVPVQPSLSEQAMVAPANPPTLHAALNGTTPAKEPSTTAQIEPTIAPDKQAQTNPSSTVTTAPPTHATAWRGQDSYTTTYQQLTADQKAALDNRRRTEPTSTVREFIQYWQMLQMWGNDGTFMKPGMAHPEGRLPNLVYGPGLFDYWEPMKQPPWTQASTVPAQPVPPQTHAKPHPTEQTSKLERIDMTESESPQATARPSGITDTSVPALKVAPVLQQYAIPHVAGSQPAAFVNHQVGRSGATAPKPAPSVASPALKGPIDARIIHYRGPGTATPRQARPVPPPVPAIPTLAENRAAANGGVAKRPAVAVIETQSVKKPRTDEGAQGRVPKLNTQGPLANVSRTAKGVYIAMVTILKDSYSKDVNEAKLVTALYLTVGKIHEACMELKALDLVVMPYTWSDDYVPVPLKTCKERHKQ